MRGEQRSQLDKIYDRNKLETVRQTTQTRQQEDNLYRITSLTLALRSPNSNNILQEPPGQTSQLGLQTILSLLLSLIAVLPDHPFSPASVELLRQEPTYP